jgi:hypothetical protein
MAMAQHQEMAIAQQPMAHEPRLTAPESRLMAHQPMMMATASDKGASNGRMCCGDYASGDSSHSDDSIGVGGISDGSIGHSCVSCVSGCIGNSGTRGTRDGNGNDSSNSDGSDSGSGDGGSRRCSSQ